METSGSGKLRRGAVASPSEGLRCGASTWDWRLRARYRLGHFDGPKPAAAQVDEFSFCGGTRGLQLNHGFYSFTPFVIWLPGRSRPGHRDRTRTTRGTAAGSHVKRLAFRKTRRERFQFFEVHFGCHPAALLAMISSRYRLPSRSAAVWKDCVGRVSTQLAPDAEWTIRYARRLAGSPSRLES